MSQPTVPQSPAAPAPLSPAAPATDYNGYANRTTWNICLWLGNDEPMYRAAVEERKRRGKMTRKAAKYATLSIMGEVTPDGCKTTAYCVNWQEVADWYNDLIDEAAAQGGQS